ncbi:hypothetical protein NN561_015877 [Cricetulus griseus]
MDSDGLEGNGSHLRLYSLPLSMCYLSLECSLVDALSCLLRSRSRDHRGIISTTWRKGPNGHIAAVNSPLPSPPPTGLTGALGAGAAASSLEQKPMVRFMFLFPRLPMHFSRVSVSPVLLPIFRAKLKVHFHPSLVLTHSPSIMTLYQLGFPTLAPSATFVFRAILKALGGPHPASMVLRVHCPAHSYSQNGSH